MVKSVSHVFHISAPSQNVGHNHCERTKLFDQSTCKFLDADFLTNSTSCNMGIGVMQVIDIRITGPVMWTPLIDVNQENMPALFQASSAAAKSSGLHRNTTDFFTPRLEVELRFADSSGGKHPTTWLQPHQLLIRPKPGKPWARSYNNLATTFH